MRAYFATIFAAFLLFAGLNTATSADVEFSPLWPDGEYRDDVPTISDVLGYDIGDHITTHNDMIRYFEALAAAKPDQVKIFDYGYTHEGRRLIYVAISSASNIKRLEEIRANTIALTDPRKTSEREAKALIKDLPATVWLAYSVHGNEISGTDSAMATAHHLLASSNDPRVGDILGNTVVFINPLQNPDGRDRFIHRFRTARGIQADSDPISAEHNEPWPSGRTNHYLFDLNRDWIVLTQPETQGHVKALLNWSPQVFIDVHEMGGNRTYYFSPEARPYNPHLVASQRESLFWFGHNNAKWFDRFGLPYFTRDVYDAFYPGYGASWPAYYGAIAMTYEQASARGLNYRRRDGSEFDFRSTVFGHFVTSLSSAEMVAEHREEILSNFYRYQQTAIEEGRKAEGEPRAYAFPNVQTDADTRKLMNILKAQGVELSYVEKSADVCGVSLKAGDIVLDAAQPRARMLRTLLNPQVDLEPEWVKEQERRRDKDYDHDIYDVTAWALPQMFNVELGLCEKLPKNLSALQVDGLTNIDAFEDSSVIALLDGNEGNTESMIAHSLRAGLAVKVHTEGFRLNGRDFGRGTLIYEMDDNAEKVGELRTIADKLDLGQALIFEDSTFVESGRSLGGRAVINLVSPKIAMAWDDGTYSYSAGNTRFVIEHQIGYPVTAIRTNDLAYADLSRYDVLVLPEGSYDRVLGKANGIKDWVRRGGVLIGQGAALRYLTNKDTGLLSAQREAQVTDGEAREKAKGARVKGKHIASEDQLRAEITPASEAPDSMPGTLLNAVADQDHWITAGAKRELVILARGSEIYTPLKLNEGRNAVRFVGGEDLLSSGYLWEDNRKQLAYKPYMMVENYGRGIVIGFTYEPTTRAYLDGIKTLYGNALLVAPSVARKVR